MSGERGALQSEMTMIIVRGQPEVTDPTLETPTKSSPLPPLLIHHPILLLL